MWKNEGTLRRVTRPQTFNRGLSLRHRPRRARNKRAGNRRGQYVIHKDHPLRVRRVGRDTLYTPSPWPCFNGYLESARLCANLSLCRFLRDRDLGGEIRLPVSASPLGRRCAVVLSFGHAGVRGIASRDRVRRTDDYAVGAHQDSGGVLLPPGPRDRATMIGTRVRAMLHIDRDEPHRSEYDRHSEDEPQYGLDRCSDGHHHCVFSPLVLGVMMIILKRPV